LHFIEKFEEFDASIIAHQGNRQVDVQFTTKELYDRHYDAGDDRAVGGMLNLDQARELRDALTKAIRKAEAKL
jgi:hypothetical protein